MKQSLIEKLNNWDGKESAYLTLLYQENINKEEFFINLVELTHENDDLQLGSTWLIKHHYDQKQRLSDNLTYRLILAFPLLKHWGAKLHMLQIIDLLPQDSTTLPYMEELSRKGLENKNKFVRAWSYQGLFEVSKHITEMQPEVLLLCREAMETESASIKSKVRKIIAALEKNK